MRSTSSLSETFRVMAGGLPRSFWVIWAGTFVTRCGNFVMPFLAIYLTQARHLSVSEAGLVVALYGAGSAIAGGVGGFLADRVGRRATMITALTCGGTGMVAVGFAQRVAVIAPAIFLVALFTDMYRPAVQAAIADLVPPADRVRAYGILYWVMNLGFSIGLTIGGALAGISFRWLFVGDGATTLLFAVLIALGVPETRPARAAVAPGTRGTSAWSEFAVPFREPLFVMFLGLSFLFALILFQIGTTFPLDMAAHGVSKTTFGLVLGINGVLIVLLQPFLGPLVARSNRSRTLAIGTALAGAGFGLNAIARTAPVYALGVVIWTVGEIGVLPVGNALVADLAPPQVRGRYQGSYSLAFGLALCAAPAIGTFVLQHFGSTVLWCGCLGLGLAISAGHLALSGPLMRLRAERVATQSLG